ncbi:gliding motility-associated C-terminal domain-containing protein [Mucilaginibacter sp.]|uniref:gliding motility-associated C-terminal domain-containing protein n=1 Tax=Mucilaginibacter sp. TaxID=1882438 RepID=UPI0026144912|nr:gliding motility-associated C-terminal domain-containing protein [Mucilaginibacter sp.]MDB4918372.1 gliding motility-associated C-terminal protein [Mucilaginibacter sp.]
MRLRFQFLIVLAITIVFALKLNAQTCSGSLGAPVINETFGAGSTYGVGLPLDPAITNLQYFADGCGGEDGQYTLLTAMGTSCKGGTWQSIPQDHTHDKYGYMMIINATLDPSLFFTYKVDGSKLCPNTTYQFAAWIMNILRPLPQTAGYSRPNITFTIEKVDGTVLKMYNTKDILESEVSTWVQYGTFFTSPSDGSDIVVKMVNNGAGGNGNDLALDDITFSACGPMIQTGFGAIGNIDEKKSCVNDNLNYTLVAQQTGYIDPTYKWQENKNDGIGWVDIPNETSLSLDVNIPNAAAGKYQYRIGILNKASVGAEQCRIYSDPLTITVYPPPDVMVSSNTSACMGQPVQLSSTGGDSYLWTGPNNFISTENSPVVTYNGSPANDGVYTLKVTRNNCPFFTSTTVKVYETATVEPLSNVTICEGNTTQLTVTGINIAHYKWSPAEGLDHDDIANPVASPSATTDYTVTVSNDGCADIKPIASVTVTVLKKPAADAGKPVKMFEGQTCRLGGTSGGDKVQFYWTPANYLDNPTSLTPTTSSPNDITYTLHVVSTENCGESTSSVFVRVYKLLTIVNSFSPNGDGINDYWYIKNIDNYPKADISVFTRYGQRVFQNIGYSKPWDGTFNGSTLPAGTYYYIIDVKDDNIPKQSGWIFIVR